jgi:SAM-dependent methyltransferase
MAQEYVTDVTYVRGFEKSLSPTYLRLCAAVNGFDVPAKDTFDYCELGCAYGDTTIALAASYPEARFVGIDLNAEHVASATASAKGGAVDNVRFIEGDFETLDHGDFPEFDYITAHGVLSWIGPQKRKAVLDFLSSKLKPGGLAYVSYNTLPGWAAVEPLRQLILARAALSPGSTLEGAKLGLEFAKALNQAGAYYFSGNPAAKAMLETMEKAGLHYVVHEYLHAHWVPMYFAQLAAEMAASDLYFVGQLPLYLNFRDVSIPSTLTSLFGQITERLAFEGLKDFALNTYFRSDVFVKGRPTHKGSATDAYFKATPFGMLEDEGVFRGEAILPNHTLRYTGPVYDALVPALRAGAQTIATLVARPELATFGARRIREAVTHLLLGECVSPMVEPTHAPAGELRKLGVPSAYNRFVLQRGLESETPTVLASRAAGNGVRLSKIDAAALTCFLEVDRAHQTEWLRRFCRDAVSYLVVGDRVITDPAEREANVLAEVEKFRATRLPKLVELGIVKI